MVAMLGQYNPDGALEAMMKNVSIIGGNWEPTNAFVLEYLTVPRSRVLKLGKFQKGLDNIHIDVLLDAKLGRAASDLVQACVHQQLHDLSLAKGLQALEVNAVEAFSEVYQAVSLSVYQAARATGRRELVQLYQLSVAKYLLLCADRELQVLRDELKAGRDDAENFARGVSLRHREHLSLLAVKHQTIRYRVCSQVLRILRKIENSELRKLRKSIIGLSWPVPKTMLFNPLLQLGGLGSEGDFLSHYPMMFYRSERFEQVNKVVADELASWLPDFVGFPSIPVHQEDFKALPIRRDTGELPGYAEVEKYLRGVMAPVEYKDYTLSWLDDASNLMNLLGGEKGKWPQPAFWRNSNWSGFQRKLLDRVEKALIRQGIAAELYASAHMPGLMRELGNTCPCHPVYEYLADYRTRKSLKQQLQNVRSSFDVSSMLKKVDRVKHDIKQLPEGYRQQVLVGVLGGYARLRHDLKSAWNAYRAMNRIKLLDCDEDIILSRSNALLNEFSVINGQLAEGNEVSGHVIIKADLRGSTQLTAKMREKDLNPAAYFSQNLFDPINKLLKEYGASKVFIEGDAVILMIPEYTGHGRNAMVIARACGLANKILDVTKRRNIENRRRGLPELELGIGIAYIDESPTYLFDEGHRITISPAINCADRLSSSASELRELHHQKGETGWGVEVVMEDSGPSGQGSLKRYNVNGIALDVPAFSHLLGELVLKKVRTTGIGGNSKDKYHIGRFPDLTGKNQWLMVREARIRLWSEGNYGERLEPTQTFYEVVSDIHMLKRLREKLSAAS